MNTSKVRWSDLFYIRHIKWWGLFLIVLLCVTSYLGTLTPKLITEVSQAYSDIPLFKEKLWELFYLFSAVYVSKVFYRLGLTRFVAQLVHNNRIKLYKSWLLSYDIIDSKKASVSDRYPQGEIMSRVISDSESIIDLVSSGSLAILIDVIFIVSYLVSFISINKTTGIFLTIVEVLSCVFLVWSSKYMRVIFHKTRDARAKIFRVMANVVGGLNEAHYNRHENYASKKGNIVFNDFLNKILKANVYDASFYSLAESLYPIFLVLVVLILPYSNITEVAVIFAIVDLIQRSINPIKGVSSKMANFQRAMSGIERMKHFYGDINSLPMAKGIYNDSNFSLEKMSVSIEQFSYPIRDDNKDSFSLLDIKFDALKSELIGIVGRSGCGKSTLLNIMAANIIPDKGLIKINSSDGREITYPGSNFDDIIHYREYISIVAQDSHIFSQSLKFNITLGHGADEAFEEFWEFINDNIAYIKTWGLGPDDALDAKDLSLGQKQLLAAIRSCYLKRPIVFFDEISSALDNLLDDALRKVILLIQKNSLTFVVAHRLETIMNANKIIVMHEGLINAVGSHRELIKTNETYQSFVDELTKV